MGKTTLIDLITGLHRPNKGSIRINNENLNNIDLVSLRNQIGYVSQDPSLFDDTILNNLTLMRDHDINEVKEILKITYCNKFCRR